MRKPRVDIGPIRRAQIVEAAVAVIAEKGLQHLSLSEIESKAGMSRGQLTYYFPAKEDILLAVFDHLIERMRQHAHAESGNGDGPPPLCHTAEGWERIQGFLTWFVLTPPRKPDFDALQYTFLSQLGHRDDFRQRLAQLYEEWRAHMAGDVAVERRGRAAAGQVSDRTVASFVQAVLQGLAIQRAADPGAFDSQEMLKLFLDLLGNYLRPAAGRGQPPTNGTGRRKRAAQPTSAPSRGDA